jgi:hypothetical protein
MSRRRKLWIPLLTSLAVVATLGVALLTTGGDSADREKRAATTRASTPTTTFPPTITTTSLPTATTVAEPTGTTGGSTSPPAAGPVITSFVSDEDSYSCPGSSSSPQPVLITLEWATQNATSVELSGDGQSRGSYAPEAQVFFNMPCDGSAHMYTLTARSADGQTVSETLSIHTQF